MGRPLSPEEKMALEAELAKSLVEYVRGEFGADDEEAVIDAIEGETNLKEAIREAALLVQQLEADADSLKKMVATYNDRKARKLHKAEMVRTAMRAALEAVAIKSMPLDIATVSIRATQPKLGDLDEAKIPSKFFTLPKVEPVLDKKQLLEALKALPPAPDGEEPQTIPGAELIPAGTTIAIKFT